jgi:hypothetical protein
MTTQVANTRSAARVQPYANNGNVSTQATTYDWIVRVNGKYVEFYSTLKKAKELASDFGQFEVVR